MGWSFFESPNVTYVSQYWRKRTKNVRSFLRNNYLKFFYNARRCCINQARRSDIYAQRLGRRQSSRLKKGYMTALYANALCGLGCGGRGRLRSGLINRGNVTMWIDEAALVCTTDAESKPWSPARVQRRADSGVARSQDGVSACRCVACKASRPACAARVSPPCRC